MKHLSRFDIEAIADKYVQAYMALPDVRNTQIYRIDPELLLEKVLGLNVEYQHLSYDGSILGMTSFTEMGVQVFEDDDNEAFFFLDGKTVLVEKDLNFDSKLKGRKNFTLMHEGSHQIFKMLLSGIKNCCLLCIKLQNRYFVFNNSHTISPSNSNLSFS